MLQTGKVPRAAEGRRLGGEDQVKCTVPVRRIEIKHRKIGLQEAKILPPCPGSMGLRAAQHPGRKIDGGDLGAGPGKFDRKAPQTTADVQHGISRAE